LTVAVSGPAVRVQDIRKNYIKICFICDGESIEVAIFSGGDERQRAIRYADREYGEFDEIELEPYQRSPLADTQ
jgi:hypothetical protein